MVNELTLAVGKPVVTPAASSQVKEASVSLPVVEKGTGVASGGKGASDSKQSGSGVSPEDVMEAVHKMRDYMQIIDRDLHFSVDEDSGITIVKVIDPATDRVVRQIPNEEVMRVVRSLESGGGLLSDIKA